MPREAEKNICWRFYGYQALGKQDVQEWFDNISEDEKDELKDILNSLRFAPKRLWGCPEFKTLGPEISEIRSQLEISQGVNRIYGAFWPEESFLAYTFLLGKSKNVKNDRTGKKEARIRLGQLRRGLATTHEFKFDK